MKIFLYALKIMNIRTGRLTGVSCGVIHAKDQTDALNILTRKAGNNAYSFQLHDVTDTDGEAFFAIPSGELIAFGGT